MPLAGGPHPAPPPGAAKTVLKLVLNSVRTDLNFLSCLLTYSCRRYLSAAVTVITAVGGQHVHVLLTTARLGAVSVVRLTSDVIAAADQIATDHMSTTALHAVIAVHQSACRPTDIYNCRLCTHETVRIKSTNV